MNPIEKKWLDYSWTVLTDHDHQSECRRQGGKGIDDPDLRWPGFLGKNYSEGGPLFIANIHRNFDNGGAEDFHLAEKLVANSKQWLIHGRSSLSDLAYLEANRDLYKIGFEHWAVRNCFQRFLNDTGLVWDDVAYINAAKCQSTEGSEPKLQKLCLKRYPLSELLAYLNPSVVLSASIPAHDIVRANVKTFLFNSRNCINQEIGNIEKWLPEATQHYKSASRQQLIKEIEEHESAIKEAKTRQATILDPMRERVDRHYDNREKRNSLKCITLLKQEESMDLPRSWADESPDRSILCVAECGFSMLNLYHKHYGSRFNCIEEAKKCNKEDTVISIEPAVPIWLIPSRLFRTRQESMNPFKELVLKFLQMNDAEEKREVFINLITGGDTVEKTIRDSAILEVFEGFLKTKKSIERIVYALERNHFPCR